MKITESELKDRFGEIIDIVMSDRDVLILRQGRVIAFIGSVDDYNLFREFKSQSLPEKLAIRELEADRQEFANESLNSIQNEAFDEFQKGKKL